MTTPEGAVFKSAEEMADWHFAAAERAKTRLRHALLACKPDTALMCLESVWKHGILAKRYNLMAFPTRF